MLERLARRAAHVLLVGCVLVAVEAGSAPAQRTFVASTGSDANSCSIAQPCRSFAAAIAQTLDGGEILVLDTAGYGSVTITKSVSIIAPPGVYGGITVNTAGANGIDINTPGVVVRLRGLSINGLGIAQHGISMQDGAQLHVQDVQIFGMADFGAGLAVSAAGSKVYASNIVARNNGYGILVGNGAMVVVDGARLDANAISGLSFYSNANVSLRNASTSGNGYHGVEVLASGGTTTVGAIDAVHAIDNQATGVYVGAFTGGTTSVDIVRSVVARNHDSNVLVYADASSIAKANIVGTAASYSATGSGIEGIGAGVVIVATDCLLNENQLVGLVGDGFATVRTRGNNTILGNGSANMAGTTPLGGL